MNFLIARLCFVVLTVPIFASAGSLKEIGSYPLRGDLRLVEHLDNGNWVVSERIYVMGQLAKDKGPEITDYYEKITFLKSDFSKIESYKADGIMESPYFLKLTAEKEETVVGVSGKGLKRTLHLFSADGKNHYTADLGELDPQAHSIGEPSTLISPLRNGNVFVDALDKSYVFDRAGKKLGEFQSTPAINGAQSLADGTLMLVTGDKILFLGLDGTEKRKPLEIKRGFYSVDATSDGTVFISPYSRMGCCGVDRGSETAYTINPDGTKRSEFTIKGRNGSPTLLGSGKIIADSTEFVGGKGEIKKQIMIVDLDGKTTSTVETSELPYLDNVVVSKTDDLIFLGNNKVMVLDASGKTKWVSTFEGEQSNPALLDAENIWTLGFEDLKVHLWDLKTGKEKEVLSLKDVPELSKQDPDPRQNFEGVFEEGVFALKTIKDHKVHFIKILN